MLVKIEDLRKGDIVLSAHAGAKLVEYKLLRQPQLATTGKLKTWYGTDRWKSIPCAYREETLVRTYTDHNGKVHTYNYIIPTVAGTKEYNKEKRVNFNDKDVWLIKRENNG